MDWSGVYYWDVFISYLDSSAPIHCRDTDAVLHFSKPDEETNSSMFQMAWGEHIYWIFLGNYYLFIITIN